MSQRNGNLLNKTSIYILLLLMSGALWLFHVYIIMANWHILPENVPIHFDLSGRPDRWGAKKALILLPLIHLGMIGELGSLTFINAKTFAQYSSSKSVQSPIQIHYSRLLLLIILVIVSLLLMDISHESICLAIKKVNPFKNASFWLLGSLFATLIFYMWASKRVKNADDNL